MTHLKIKQGSNVEIVPNNTIETLYNISKNNTLDESSDLLGNLQVVSAYEDSVSYLTTKYPNLTINTTVGKYIRFVDNNVLTVLLQHIGDGVGITTLNVLNLSTIDYWFLGNTSIINFPEFSKFTGLNNIPGESINQQRGAFKGCTNLKTITLPTTVTTINANAFNGDSALLSIDLSNVNIIGDIAFTDCISLSNIGSLANATDIGSLAFYKCPIIGELSLPSLVGNVGGFSCTNISKVTNLGNAVSMNFGDGYHPYNSSFSNCPNLTEINLPSTITLIGGMFNNSKLTTVNFDSTVTIIKSECFNGDSLLSTISSCNNVTTVESYAFAGCSNISSLVFSNKLTTIGTKVFRGCTNLTTIGDVSGVTSFDADTLFENCKKLTSLNFTHLPVSLNRTFDGCNALTTVGDLSTVTTLGYDVFRNCTNLGITVNMPNLTGTIDYGCFYLSGIVAILDLGTITKIQDRQNSEGNVFGNCPNLTTVILPTTLAYVGSYAFLSDTNLTTVTFKGNVLTYIGSYAFDTCSKLTTIDFQPGTTTSLSLGKLVFGNCPLLNKIILPSNVTTLALGFLNYHDNASTIVLNPTTVPTLNGAIGGSTSTIFYVPDSALTAYKAATNWSTMSSRIKGMSTYPIGTEIPSKAFLNWTGLANMDLTNVTLINDHAFAGSGLANNYTVGPMLICSSTVESTIKEWAFWGAKLIESITLPYVSNIGTGAFSDCTALLRVILGSHIVGIGNLCFLNCTALDFIHIDSTACPVLSSCAFDGAKSTFKIYVPDAQVSAYKAASVWSTFADKIYSFTQLDTDFPGTR